jgi:hypothetical protein
LRRVEGRDHVAGHARHDEAGAARGDHAAELLEHKGGADEVDGEDRGRRRCTGETPAVWTTLTTSPSAAAASASAWTEPREDTSTGCVSTAWPVEVSVSAAGVEGLLVEVCEEDCSSCPLAACDRLADAARADGDDYFFLVHRVLLSTLAVDHRLLRGLVAVAGSGDLCRFDLA